MFDTFTRADTDISQSPPAARFSLRFDPEQHGAMVKALKIVLPETIQGLQVKGDIMAAMLGPDEWFIIMPEADRAAFEQRCQGVGVVHSLVDISAREIGLELKGENAEWMVQAFCPADLAVMPAPAACRTVFGAIQIILCKLSSSHYRIEVWRSFAPHVWHELEVVAAERAAGL